MQEICRFLDLFYHLEVIELLHGLCLDLVTHVDVQKLDYKNGQKLQKIILFYNFSINIV